MKTQKPLKGVEIIDCSEQVLVWLRVLKAHNETQDDNQQVAIDSEANGDDPHSSTPFALQLYVVGAPALVIDLRQALDNDSRSALNEYLGNENLLKLWQNGKYDLKMLAAVGIKVAPPYFDTMLANQILRSGTRQSSGLGDLCKVWLGLTLDKGLQTSFVGLSADAVLTPEQLAYAAKDVQVLPDLAAKLRAALSQHRGNARTWQREEKFLPVLAQLEAGGVRFQETGLKRLLEQKQKQLETARLYAQGHLPQISTLFGLEPPDLDQWEDVVQSLRTAGLKCDTASDLDLLKLADQPGVLPLLNYRRLKQQIQIVKDWLGLKLRPVRPGLSFHSRSEADWHSQAEVIAKWGALELTSKEKQQFHLMPCYRQIGYGNSCGQLSDSHTGIKTLLPLGDLEQEDWVARMLKPSRSDLRLIGVRIKEGPLRMLAQVTGNEKLCSIYCSGGLAVEWLIEAAHERGHSLSQELSWALWLGCGIRGYQRPANWHLWAYQELGIAVSLDDAKRHMTLFWTLMGELLSWHQHNPTPREGCRTLAGRYCHLGRASHAARMEHRVLGSLDDLVKRVATTVSSRLSSTHSRPYLILGDYLIWQVPQKAQHQMLDVAAQALHEGGRALLPSVVKHKTAAELEVSPDH